MPKFSPILLSVTVLLIGSLACAVPTVSVAPDQNAVGTMVAQTIVAGLTQSAPSRVPVGLESGTPLPTFTPELPTLSPTATLTATPIFTATPMIPQVSVSLATNCRVGPGRVYDRVGALLVGQVAEVFGRDVTGKYWYIRNPNSSTEFCWLWGQYATLTGNFVVLPIFTPPPTPTPMPDFAASYSTWDTCSGWWVNILLKNSGGTAFRSVSMTVRDMTTDIVVSLSSDGFTTTEGCLAPVTKDDLQPGKTRTISSPVFAYNLAGHRLRATITLCSNLGQNGMCVTRVITFKVT